MKALLKSRVALMLGVWIVATVWMALGADRGWIPHDEGTLAQTGERVLAGELPHRDFDDRYTGGLAFLNALGFKLFGVNLLSLRITLLIVASLFVPAVFSIAARVVSPVVAAVVTLLCVAWSVPNYFSGLPSWYNLFFATFGAVAVLRHMETNHVRWLFVAGLFGGVSFLFKIVGLYFIAGVLLTLVYREQVRTEEEKTSGRSPGYEVFVGIGVLCFAAALTALVLRRPTVMDAFHFLAPGLALCGVLGWNERRIRSRAGGGRYRRLTRLVAPFVVGAAVPVAFFIVPYAMSSSLDDLWRGLFVLPLRSFAHAGMALPPAYSLVTALPLAALLIVPMRGREWPAEAAFAMVAAVISIGVLLFAGSPLLYQGVWFSVRPIVPITVLAGAVLLVQSSRSLTARRRQQLFLLLSLAAMLSLVQLPFSSGVYFCYIAPFAVLAVTIIGELQPMAPRRLYAYAGAFYFMFAVLWLNPGYSYSLGYQFRRIAEETPLEMERGGIRTAASLASEYSRVVDQVQRRSREGDFIYATPDVPEIYFLCNRRNPTRTIFEFLDEDVLSDPEGRIRRILSTLEQKAVDVVVIRHVAPEFSVPTPPELLRVLEQRFPNELEYSYFNVRWRERPE